MADLASILTDPNYTGANEATKRAIFDKFSANDANYTSANDATKAAIQQKFGVATQPQQPKRALVVGGELYDFNGQESFNRAKSLTNPSVDDIKMLGGTLVPRQPVSVDQIPLDPARAPIAPAPAPPPAPSGVPGPRTQSTVRALGRAAAGLADTTLGGVAAPLVEYANYNVGRMRGVSPEQARANAQKAGDVFAQPFGRAAGVTNTPEYKGEASQQAIQFIGENLGKGTAWLAKATGIAEPDVQNLIDTTLLLGPKPIRQAAGKAATVAAALPEAAARAIAPEIGPVPGLERKVQKAAAASAADFKASGRIDAAQWGFANGFVQPAVQSNPTMANRARAALKGENSQERNAAATEKNLARVDELARKDMGIGSNVALTSDAPFIAARARPQVAGPYDQIGRMNAMRPDTQLDGTLANLEVSPTVTEKAAAYNAQIESLRGLVEAGNYDGAAALKDIKKLRKESNAAWKRNDVTAAEFSQGLANAIEDLVERNLVVPKDINKFKAARREMAKTYAWESALDFNTGKFDPLKIAKITGSEPGRYTGTLQGLGQYAGNFPDAVSTFGGPSAGTRIIRSSPSAMAGYAVGSLAGQPWLGGAIGAGIGEAVNALSSSGLTSAAARQRALPADRRIRPDEPYIPPPGPSSPYTPPVGPASPYNPNVVGPNFMLNPGGVPPSPQFAPANQLAIGMRVGPNFTMPQRPAPSPIPPNAPNPMTAARTALPNEPYSPATGERLRQQQRDIDQRAAEAADAAAAAAEGQRAPTRGGVELSFDPFINKLRPVEQAGEALTPTNALASAVDKMQSGQSFAMSATEKIAWKKAQSDLKLATDGAYASKFTPDDLFNRQWLLDTVTKARQKADAFDEIAKRATQADAARVPGAKVPSAAEIATAKTNRDRMLDFAEDLQDRLSALPKKKLGQGPKTLNALRDGRTDRN